MTLAEVKNRSTRENKYLRYIKIQRLQITLDCTLARSRTNIDVRGTLRTNKLSSQYIITLVEATWEPSNPEQRPQCGKSLWGEVT